MLGVLCESDQKQSEQVYEVLDQTMKRADTGINAGYAIIYECVRTVARIYPNPKLLDNAAAAISRCDEAALTRPPMHAACTQCHARACMHHRHALPAPHVHVTPMRLCTRWSIVIALHHNCLCIRPLPKAHWQREP